MEVEEEEKEKEEEKSKGVRLGEIIEDGREERSEVRFRWWLVAARLEREGRGCTRLSIMHSHGPCLALP